MRKITWLEFKQRIEDAGVQDDMTIDFVDVNFDMEQTYQPRDFSIHIKDNSFNVY